MRRAVSLAGILALIAALLSGVAPAGAVGAIIHVDEAASGLDDGSSWGDAFTDLQAALATATAGDEIRVAQGTYRPAASDRTVSFALADGVTVTGGYATGGAGGPDADLYPTILSGDLAGDGSGPGSDSENSHRVVTADGVGPDTMLAGFTVTGGRAAGAPPDYSRGGGIDNVNGSRLLMADLRVVDNQARWGGGIANDESSPTIIRSIVAGNSATHGGGGINNLRSSPVISNTVLDGNSGSDGGAITNDHESAPRIVNSVLSNNEADIGGAIANWRSSPTIINSVVADNTAFLGSRAAIVTNVGGHITIVNSIVWANTTGMSSAQTSTVSVSYSNIQGWTGGVGNSALDPMFVGPGDYHLQPVSPARERGNDAAVPADVFDIDADLDVAEPTPDLDGNPRILGTVDMGVYEDPSPALITPGVVLVPAEGDSGSTFWDLPVYLSYAVDDTVTVDWATVDNHPDEGVAQAGTDFAAADGTVTFQPGETEQWVQIEVFGDMVDDPPLLWGEWGLVEFSNPTNALLDTFTFFGHGIFVIIDDDPDLPYITPGAVGGTEGDTGSTFWDLPITLSAPSAVPVTVEWATVDDAVGPGLAQAGSDYVAAAGEATFEPGETQQHITLEILGDTLNEPPLLWGEWGLVEFSNPTNAWLDTTSLDGQGIFIIADDDERSLTLVPPDSFDGGDTVTVQGSGWTPGATIALCQAADDPSINPPQDACLADNVPLPTFSADTNGAFTTEIEARRWGHVPGLDTVVDCTAPSPGCVLGAAETADVTATITAVPLEFATPPAPPLVRGALTVTPSADLVDGETVGVAGNGFRADEPIDVYQCSIEPNVMGPAGCESATRIRTITDAAGSFSLSFVVAQTLLGVDCATGTCYLTAAEAVDFEGTYVAEPLSFAVPPLGAA